MRIKKRTIVWILFLFIWGWLMWKLKEVSGGQINENKTEEKSVVKIEKVELDDRDNFVDWEKKLGQMFVVGIDGQELSGEEKVLLEQSKIGGVILLTKNVDNEEQLYNLTTQIKKTATISGIIPFVSVDQEGGVVTRIPFVEDTAQQDIKDSYDALTVALERSKELSELGININYSPVVEISDDESSFSYQQGRSFGIKHELIYENTINGCKEAGILCVAKHFPGGLVRVTNDPHWELPVLEIERKELDDDLIVFKSLIESGAEAIMVTHIYYPKIDSGNISSASNIFIKEILRGEMGFEGLVFADDIGMGAVNERYELVDFMIKSIKAGANILIVSDRKIYDENWEKLVEKLKEDSELRESVKESFERIKEYKLNRI